MFDKVKRVLVLAPHPDDGELGCGATMYNLVRQDVLVNYAVFSPCYKSVPEGMDKNVLYEEVELALGHLGIGKESIRKFEYPVREFTTYRQEILEDLIQLKREINPDLILLPNSDDIHQDHHVIYSEGLRAFKTKIVLGYELLWNNRHFKSNCFIKVEQRDLQAKIAALSEYRSQQFRNYFKEEFILSHARVRGTQIGVEYAEAYEWITGIL